MKRILCVASIALLVSACAAADRKNKLAVATVAGALSGAYAGWRVFGAGATGILAILGIGAAGAGAAYLTAEILLPRERESLHRATYRSLEHGTAGAATTWTSADSQLEATITPLKRYRSRKGRLCRKFALVFRIGKTREAFTRTACRGHDGSWQTV